MSQLPKVGQNLRRLRNGLGLSLDEASKLTGVSKAMLGQIERGESSPTISTLWKISSGLKVNFISLLDDNRNQLVLVKKDEIHPIKEENGKMIIYPIFPFDSKNGIDVFLEEIEKFADYVESKLEFGSNMRASKEFRSHLCKVLVRRCINEIGGM